MTMRLETIARRGISPAGKDRNAATLGPTLVRCPRIRQLIAINDLCIGLDIAYDDAVRQVLGYENEDLNDDEATAVLGWLLEKERDLLRASKPNAPVRLR